MILENEMMITKYTYDVEVVSVYDGDTIRVNIDLGFGHVWKGSDGKGVKIRLFGINTPEVRGEQREEGLKSKQYLINLLSGERVVLKTRRDKTGKYGRYLGELYIQKGEREWMNINKTLVKEGYAEHY